MSLTSKERVRKAMNHVEPDRVPTHLNATRWVIDALKDTLQVTTDRELLNALHIDIFDMRGIDIHGGVMPKYIGPDSIGIPKDWSGNIVQLWGIEEILMETAAGRTFVQAEYPLRKATAKAELEQYPWPDPDWFDYSELRSELEAWSDFTILCSGCSVFQHPTYLRSMDIFMMDMVENQELAVYILDKFTNFYAEFFRRIFEQAADLIDIFALADDLGMQNTLLISPRMFDRFVAPRLKLMADLAHEYGVKLLLHSDGNIKKILPRLIELGVDILDPIQPEAMNPIEVKQNFGDRLCLRGGISAQHVLPHGTKNEVVAETRRILQHLSPGGGYILSPGHPVLQEDIPAENIITMYETAFKYGRYEKSP